MREAVKKAKQDKGGCMKKFLIIFSVLLVTACASHKPAPGWPDGQERPINAQPVVKPIK